MKQERWVCQWWPQRVKTIFAGRLYDHDIIVFIWWLPDATDVCVCVCTEESNGINIIR